VVSFFNFWAGLSGLLAVVLTLLIGQFLHVDSWTLRRGVYSFNALLIGLGMGTFFDPGIVYFTLLSFASLLTFLLSVTLGGRLFKLNLPFLSLPFVIAFWFVVLPSSHFENLGLTQRNIFWINEMYAKGGDSVVQIFQLIDNYNINKLLDIYLRSLSSIFFQNNLIAGFLIALALLYSSRIMFSLSVIGFLSAYFFAQYTGSEAAVINYYNIGANYMMVAFAIGGYFLIPSKQSFLWTIFLIPLTSLVLLFFYQLFGYIHLPVFSFPFAFVVILFLYFLQLRTKANKLILTPLQLNSPEKNLYSFRNNKIRLAHWLYFPIFLPFTGDWTVTQAHNGEFTHKGEWGQAFDFMISDSNQKTFRTDGFRREDYYCYNKPIYAPANGYVEIIIDNVNDNEIGQINTIQNWGNSIVIRHIDGLYSQISHLRRGTFKVSKGEYVQRGDLLANCGNSGRSPEPHLHFQMQTLPIIGARTLDYPFAYYFKNSATGNILQQFRKPENADKISGVSTHGLIASAFDFQPNTSLSISYTDEQNKKKSEVWQIGTDAYNYKYIYCVSTNSTAYFINDGVMFYFTSFYGNKKSALFLFYQSAYKIFLGADENVIINDLFPLNLFELNNITRWAHDFIAPFFSFIQINYQSRVISSQNALDQGEIIIGSFFQTQIFGKRQPASESTLTINQNGLSSFEFHSKKTNLSALCIKC
jgi:urea transporter